MRRIVDQPAFLLLIVGALLGANFPIGKMATAAGVPGLVWAALVSISAAAALGVYLLLRRKPVPFNRQHMRYFCITAVTAYAVPNTLAFAAIPHLGSGLTSIFYAISPIITLLLASIAGLRKPTALEIAGIVVGVTGAFLVVNGRGETGKPAEVIWVLAGLLVPVSLAIGNVYRTLDWPENADPIWLAVGSHAIAGAGLASLTVLLFDIEKIALIARVPVAVAAQVCASVLMLPLFFRLQQVGGPVTLSQIGIVAAGVGVGVGSFVLGERYASVVWIGVTVIALGVTLTVLARLRESANLKPERVRN